MHQLQRISHFTVISYIDIALASSLMHRFTGFKKKMKENFMFFPVTLSKKSSNLRRNLWTLFSSQKSASQNLFSTFPYNSYENCEINEIFTKLELPTIFIFIYGMQNRNTCLKHRIPCKPKKCWINVRD